jgi:hypothetical protein
VKANTRTIPKAVVGAVALTLLILAGSAPLGLAWSQEASDPQHTVEVSWNRWTDYDEVISTMERFAAAWPEFLTLESIGDSYGGRPIMLMRINNPATGPEMSKAAMYIEANIHGNEIQGGETSLYTIWYLMENYGRIDKITELVDERVFYIVPSVNPDGRDYFMHGTGQGSRTGHMPVDNDNDGLFDEDPADDMNGNGVIETIRKYVPGEGTHRISYLDSRLMEEVPQGEKGDWILLGREGTDDDGDGRVNEDPIGGYDPNRNFAADWEPNYIQGGAMEYPFQLPEASAVNDFLMAHPNIGGMQTYHNSGGMILRPPGSEYRGEFPAEDLEAYDALGETGERILPFYRYMILWNDLYTVHGGVLDWTADGLGIISFSNELWNGGQYFTSPDLKEDQQDPFSPITPRQGVANLFFDDLLEFGNEYVEWAPFDHPVYGAVEMGGWKKTRGRLPPRFMQEELAHRNMAFTLFQADEMPMMTVGETSVERVDDDVFRVRVDFTNPKIAPTITEAGAQNKVVPPDLIVVAGDVEVLNAGWVENKFAPGASLRIDQHDLKRIMVRNGHPGRVTRTLEYLVRGDGDMTVRYVSVKGGTVEVSVELD